MNLRRHDKMRSVPDDPEGDLGKVRRLMHDHMFKVFEEATDGCASAGIGM
jgi:hypothetical protein